MNATAMTWLVRDVFYRARATGFSLVLFATSLAMTLIAFSAQYNRESSELSILFGYFPILSAPTVDEAVRNFLFVIAAGAGGVVGLLVTLIATAGFLPTFLDPAVSTVLMCKPISRTELLLGRSIGIVLFVALHAGLFILGCGIGLGITTGTWIAGYWLAWPILVIQFLAFFSFAALIAVATRNTITTMLAGIFFWLISWGISFGRNFLVGSEIPGPSQGMGRTVDLAYTVLPKPTDFSLMLHDAIGIRPEGLANLGLRQVQEFGLYNPTMSVLSALAVAGLFLSLAAFELQHQDY